jgi:hypothetical protein
MTTQKEFGARRTKIDYEESPQANLRESKILRKSLTWLSYVDIYRDFFLPSAGLSRTAVRGYQERPLFELSALIRGDTVSHIYHKTSNKFFKLKKSLGSNATSWKMKSSPVISGASLQRDLIYHTTAATFRNYYIFMFQLSP